MGYDQHIVGSAERAELRQFGRGSKRKRYHFEPAGELFNGLEVPAPARRFLDALAPLSWGGSTPPIVPSSCKEGAAVAPFRHRHLGNLNVNPNTSTSSARNSARSSTLSAVSAALTKAEKKHGGLRGVARHPNPAPDSPCPHSKGSCDHASRGTRFVCAFLSQGID